MAPPSTRVRAVVMRCFFTCGGCRGGQWTVAGDAAAVTRAFLLRPCQLQLPWWLAVCFRSVSMLSTAFDMLHSWLDVDHARVMGWVMDIPTSLLPAG